MLKDLCASFLFPSEISSMFKLKFGGYVRPLRPEPLETLAKELNDLDFCYAVLNKVSRSFAVVIQQLPECLKDPVCIFYLVLRGLDSVEDDMTFDVKQKVELLKCFHEKLYIDGWTIENVGDSADYRILLKYFNKVINVFSSLEVGYQRVIVDITDRMGVGMAEYATKTASIDTVDSYNLYCHYVAGLVGHGLSALFAASKLEEQALASQHKISNSMGLFLQKTNIIRDYVEDLHEGRTWWPAEIWKLYGKELSDFEKAPTSPTSLACLNHMVTDALQLVPDCLLYLSMLHDQKIFEFCAIPQVMAMATLELCYNNTEVLSRKAVKIRKGLSCKLMLNSCNLQQVHGWFHAFAKRLLSNIPANDPNVALTRKHLNTVLNMTRKEVEKQNGGLLLVNPTKISAAANKNINIFAWIIFLITLLYALARLSLLTTLSSTTQSSFLFSPTLFSDFIALSFTLLSLGHLFGLFGMQYV